MQIAENQNTLKYTENCGAGFELPSPTLAFCSDYSKEIDGISNSGKSQTKQGSDEVCSENQIDQQFFDEKRLWSEEEEMILLDLHNKWGNKWTDISLKLKGRNHNSVKNYFYSQIRKAIRRINFFISLYIGQKTKPLNMSHTSKMITVLSERSAPLKEIQILLSEREQQIFEMKETFFEYAKKAEREQLTQAEIKKLRQFLEKVSFFENEMKKSAPNGKRPKGRPAKKPRIYDEEEYLLQKQSPKTISSRGKKSEKSVTVHSLNVPTEELEISSSFDWSKTSFFLLYCLQVQQKTQNCLEKTPENSLFSHTFQRSSFKPFQNNL